MGGSNLYIKYVFTLCFIVRSYNLGNMETSPHDYIKKKKLLKDTH